MRYVQHGVCGAVWSIGVCDMVCVAWCIHGVWRDVCGMKSTATRQRPVVPGILTDSLLWPSYALISWFAIVMDGFHAMHPMHTHIMSHMLLQGVSYRRNVPPNADMIGARRCHGMWFRVLMPVSSHQVARARTSEAAAQESTRDARHGRQALGGSGWWVLCG